MKKKKNTAFIVLIGIILSIGFFMVIYRILQDENQLTVTEKRYITENKSSLISINVVNDANVFGSAGTGVYYEFLEDIEEEHGLEFNIITSSVHSPVSGLSLAKSTSLPQNANVFYIDHYVLVSKTSKFYEDVSNIKETIGILTKDVSLISNYQKSSSLTVKNYNTKQELLKGLEDDECTHILVPMMEYLDTILENLYSINYHFSDIKDYYFMTSSDNDILTSILTKFYNVWILEEFKEEFDESEFRLFTTKLKITEKELDVINNKKYNYGFIANKPFDIEKGGTYGGIANIYLKRFSDFSGITFEPKEYSSLSKLEKAMNSKKVDLFVNYYGKEYTLSKVDTIHTMDISVVMNNKDSRTFTSLSALKGQYVYVKDNSFVKTYLEKNGYSTVTYNTDKELTKLLKRHAIVAMDKMNYLVYRNENKHVNERFSVNTDYNYEFISPNDTMFNRLFTYYVSTLDKNEVIYSGIDDYNRAEKSGTIIYNITKYAVILSVSIAVITFIIYKFGKRVHIKKKIKKVDKMKYIDMLTSLKNRNFLSENLSIWNQNTIYPQAIIVIDLNSLQDLNDTYGYTEGDRQIQAAANVLIKTQLDNTEVMRTDGNEFTIYMVGYSEKQVLSYIKKLNKEFKNLPHDKGAAIGFSMIEDDVKLIDDAINEATEKMRENKELAQGDAHDTKI